MLAPRWRKVLRDIAESPVRAGVAVLAMVTGVFGTSMILTSSSILERELAVTYESTHPASAILVASGVTDHVVDVVRALPDVQEAEARPVLRGRVRVGEDEWVPLTLFVVRDFSDVRIDSLARDRGRLPAAPNEVVIERTALSVAQAAVGDAVTVRLAGARDVSLQVTGTVHAAGLAPGWMDHIVSGWVTWDSLARAAVTTDAVGLRIIVNGDRTDAQHISRVAQDVGRALEPLGVTVLRTEIPPPGRHPHADQMDTFLYLLGAFGLLALVLGAVLVATMIHALLADQVRQIGIMKALGGSTAQMASMYLGQVACLAAAALAVGMPMGYLAGRAYADFAAGILNATIGRGHVPAWVVVTEILLGMGVPLLIALRPVVRAARIDVRQALDVDVRGGPQHAGRTTGRAGPSWVPRLWMLSIRATAQQTGRLLLTVGTLVAAGVVFIAALNTSAAWDVALERDSAARPYDLEVRLARPHSREHVLRALGAVPSIVHVEDVRERSATVPVADAAPVRITLSAPDAGSSLLRLEIIDGRWLEPRDGDAVVVNTALRASVPGLRVGAILPVRVRDRDLALVIVGIAKEMSPQPIAYVSHAVGASAFGDLSGSIQALRIVTQTHDADAQRAGQREVERALSSAAIEVSGLVRLLDRRQAFADHLVIIESALLFASLLVVFVGGLGLASTLGLNVLERTREFGILGAIGATPRTVSSMVVFEGMLIVIGSWLLAVALALPVTMVTTRVAGQMFHKAPLDLVMAPSAAATWLGLILVLGTLSSLVPARRAARMSVREALQHV